MPRMNRYNDTQRPAKSDPRLTPFQALPKGLKYQHILPKRTSSQAQDTIKRIHIKPRLPRGTCRVAACRRDDCVLQSHRFYNPRRLTSYLKASLQTCDEQEDVTESTNHLLKVGSQNDLAILNGGVDGLPSLPLGGMEESTCRQLFHRFFAREYHVIDRIMKPPPVNQVEKQQAVRAKQRLVHGALSEPVFCLHLIAAVHYQVVLKDNSQINTKTTRTLHNKILSLLREKLDSFQTAEIIDLVLVILTLVQFEIAANRTDSLCVHRHAIDHLVSSQGGVHNMGYMIPYVYTVDRVLALFTDTPPRYATRVDRGFRRPSRFAHLYGVYFESKDMNIAEESVIRYCADACRAIEILENTGLMYEPDMPIPSDSTSLHYFYFIKECLMNDFAFINAEMAGRQDTARCITLAARCVDYVALQHNYIRAISLRMVNALCDILYQQHIDEVWKDCRNVLRWILFVMICVPNEWVKRGLTVKFLRQELNREYGGHSWPQSWRESELDNVRKFVWSDTRFNRQFCQRCDEIVNTVGSVS